MSLVGDIFTSQFLGWAAFTAARPKVELLVQMWELPGGSTETKAFAKLGRRLLEVKDQDEWNRLMGFAVSRLLTGVVDEIVAFERKPSP